MASYPKRLDLWNVYLDKEVKAGDIRAARNLLERLVRGNQIINRIYLSAACKMKVQMFFAKLPWTFQVLEDFATLDVVQD